VIKGVHTMFYSSESEALRAFIRDKLGFPYTDVGDGWLIFNLPEADMGCHPSDTEDGQPSGTHYISFYCDNIEKTVAELRSREWNSATKFRTSATDWPFISRCPEILRSNSISRIMPKVPPGASVSRFSVVGLVGRNLTTKKRLLLSIGAFVRSETAMRDRSRYTCSYHSRRAVGSF
jgi:hypothetical protein